MAAEKRGARFEVAVIGPGALGLLYACGLSGVVRTAVVARNAARAAELRKGVLVAGARFRPVAFSPDALPQADWILILVKAHQTRAAARLAARMKPKGVLSLQNGLVEEVLKKALPEIRAAQGVSTEGAYREGSKVVHAGTGASLLPAGFSPLGRHLAKAGFRVRIARDLKAARLRKLLVNVCMNPVTALFRIPNGRALEPPYSAFTEALAREAAAVLHAEGLKINAQELIAGVAKATAKNRSSMLQDVLAGRKTEIDELNGALIRLARRHRMALPTHVAFYRLIKLLEPR